MTDKQREILEKIKKLQNHAESAEKIGNEEEARAFAGKVQELLTAYKLSISDVERMAGHVEEEIDITYVRWREDLRLEPRKRPVGWIELLARIVAKAYYCEFVAARGRNGKQVDTGGYIGYFCGAQTDRVVCYRQYVILARYLEVEATNAYNFIWKEFEKSGEDVKELRGFRSSWITGFLVKLHERFEEEVRPKNTPEAQATANAIVLVKRNALARVHHWLSNREHRLTQGESPEVDATNEIGFVLGIRAAEKVDLKQKALNQPVAGRLASSSKKAYREDDLATCLNCGEKIRYQDGEWLHSMFSRSRCTAGVPKEA